MQNLIYLRNLNPECILDESLLENGNAVKFQYGARKSIDLQT
jgi:hypothetical protein